MECKGGGVGWRFMVGWGRCLKGGGVGWRCRVEVKGEV